MNPKPHSIASRVSLALAVFIPVLVATALVGGCGSPDLPPYRGGFKPESAPEDPVHFRNLFCAVAEQAGYSRADVLLQVLLPTKTPLLPLTANELAAHPDVTALFKQRFGGIYPSYLYENGKAQGPEPARDHRSVFESKGPATLIVVPGFFGEFVECRPFEAVLGNTDSAFHQACQPGLAGVDDRAYDLEARKEQQHRLDELVMTASYDDIRTRKPLVNVILLYPRRGTLETLGDISDAADIYLRRLDKAFQVIPESRTKNLFLLGYSQGAPVALDLLVKARADASRHPWAARIKGMISLAGVVYGSGLADQAIQDDRSSEHELLRIMKDLSESLEVDEDGDTENDKAEKKLRNTGRWTSAVAKLAQIAVTGPPAPPGLEREVEHADAIDLGYLFRTVKSVLFDMFKLDEAGEYFDNVRRFKVLARAAIVGAEGLSTASRLDWWRTHVVPSDVVYFSVAGSMPDAMRKGAPALPFLKSPYYGMKTADYPGLRKSFYGLFETSGVELNDSQVTVPKARFWPELSRHLNPAQPRFRAHFMGVVGTHHWGVALHGVAQSRHDKRNHFPRTVLLEAMAAFVLEKTE